MKKMWIPVIIMSVAVVFMAGLYFGTDIEANRIQRTLERDHIFAEYIAVVNADMGVMVDGERLNYAAAIIETLGEGFMLASPVMAQNGMREGIFRAVLTFPSNVSERILSFNTINPERVMLEFQVNPNLSESDYIETHVELMNLQVAINLTMGYTYLSSVLSQFHLAQDEMGVVFGNKDATSDAINVVRLEDFTPTLELELLPEVEFEYVEADTSEHLLTVTGFAEMVRDIYLTNFETAGMSYDIMEGMASSLVEGFPIQRQEWLDAVGAWTIIWLEYAADLRSHSNDLEEHRIALSTWRTEEGAGWHDELSEYGDDLDHWYGMLYGWYSRAGIWRDVTQIQINTIKSDLEHHVPTIEGALNDARELQLNPWHGALSSWREGFFSPNLQNFLSHLAARPQFEFNCVDPAACADAECGLATCLIGDCDPVDPEYCDCVCSDCDEAHTQECIDANNSDHDDDVYDWEYDLINVHVAALKTDAEENGELVYQWSVPPPSFPFASDWPLGSGGLSLDFLDVEINEMLFGEPPEYRGSTLPGVPDLPDGLEDEIVLPEEPRETSPPAPDDLWSGIDFMGEIMGEFDIGEFLTDELWDYVQSLLDAYEDYLDIIRDDLAFQFLENILILGDVRFEYIDYLRELREAALDAEFEAREDLEATIYEFLRIADSTSLDTRERLSEFASMMPNTRAHEGVNQDLINFSIAPVELVAPAVRGDFGLEFTSNAGLFLLWLWFALALVGLAFLVVISIHFAKRWKYYSRTRD